MSALFGIVGGSRPFSPSSQAIEALRLGPGHEVGKLLAGPGVWVGAVRPQPRTAMAEAYSAGGIDLVLVGMSHCLGSASSALADFHQHGLTALLSRDGTYGLLLHDQAAARIHLFTDPLCTSPLCYGLDSGRLAFGPDPFSVLRLLERRARMPRAMALQFLVNRYGIGDDCMLEGVRRLAPGERLEFDLRTGELRTERYWDLRYQSDLHRPEDAVALLDETLRASHQRMFDELGSANSGDYRIFLTGGMDSRGILAYAADLGCLPDLSLTWGARGDLPGSDPVIAGRLAEQLGADYAFVEVDGQGWADHAPRWAEISALASDNGNSFATALCHMDSWGCGEVGFVVLGDELFGAGPMPSGEAEVIDNVMRTSMRGHGSVLTQILGQSAATEALGAFDDRIANVLARCPHTELKDRQDYLFFHTYIARWILAPGNFKEPVYEARRPLMSLEVVDAVLRLAPLLRVDKTAFVQLMRRRFPDLLRQPLTASDSGVDWAAVCRGPGPVAELLPSLLAPNQLNRLPIAGDLDQPGLMALFQGLLVNTAPRTTRAPEAARMRRRVYDLRRKISRSPLLARAVSRLQPMVLSLLGQAKRESQVRIHQLLLRLAMLVLLQDAIDAHNAGLGKADGA